jgi:hypothetical protein
VLDGFALAAPHGRGLYEVIGHDAIEAVLGLEKQQDLLGSTPARASADYLVALLVLMPSTR